MVYEAIVNKWMRRIRGALGMGFIWAVAWSAVGNIPRFVLANKPDAPFPIIFGVLGFAAGVTFSVVLILIEGRRRFDQMSLGRFAAWGALGGFGLGALFANAISLSRADFLAVTPAFALASAACAAGSLALARRAVPTDALERGASGSKALGSASPTDHPHAVRRERDRSSR